MAAVDVVREKAPEAGHVRSCNTGIHAKETAPDAEAVSIIESAICSRIGLDHRSRRAQFLGDGIPPLVGENQLPEQGTVRAVALVVQVGQQREVPWQAIL